MTVTAPQLSAKNQNTAERLITEILSRLTWIGVEFLDSPGDEEEGGKVDEKRVRLLGYGCGSGFISRVRLYFTTCFSS
jgi:hypothetical protein